MEGIVLFLVIILYAELSLCSLTRSIGQTLFYTHSLGLIIPMYAPTTDMGLLQGMGIYILGFAFCAQFSDTRRGKIIFWGLACLTTYFYLSVFTKNLQDILIFNYSIVHNSDTIFRWGVLFALGTCSQLVEKDKPLQLRDIQLAIGAFMMMWVFGGA